MERNLIIETTSDGSNTIFVPVIDEHYHSIHGAKQESLHVFITSGLDYIQKDISPINIFEVGFGTGLNAILTLEYAKKNNLKINYHTVELYPIEMTMIDQLNYNELSPYYRDIHLCNWNQEIEITKNFTLHKIKTDFVQARSFLNNFDLIYFDAFAPDKQPEMWSQSIFDDLYTHTNQNGIFCTYCAKGMIRRMLQQAGYKVERLPGPPGKREMIRAQKST